MSFLEKNPVLIGGVLVASLFILIAVMSKTSQKVPTNTIIESYGRGVEVGTAYGKEAALLRIISEIEKNGFVELKNGDQVLKLIPQN